MAITNKKNNRISRLNVNQENSSKFDLNISVVKNDTYYQNLKINTAKGVCYLKIFRYLGCPNLKKVVQPNQLIPSFVSATALVYMNRDSAIENIYEALCNSGKELEGEVRNATVYGHYVCLRDYVRWCDSSDNAVKFTGELALEYINFQISKLLSGKISASTVASRRAAVSLMLKHHNLHKAVKLLPSVNVKRGSSFQSLTDHDYINLAKALMLAYKSYSSHLVNKTTPSICPHFNENRLVDLGYSKKEINREHLNAKRRIKSGKGDWRNILSKHAIMLTHMFTGINQTPLFNLTRKDVSAGFKKGVGSYYTLNTIKGRALYQKQINEIGFSKHAKRFFEDWLTSSEIILTSDGREMHEDDPVFPYVGHNGIRSWGRYSESPQLSINKALKPYGYPKINASIYRKTRSDKLFRALNDTAVVARANNNSVSTTEKHYLFGAEETHQIRLASAFIAQHDIAKGKNKKIALKEHEIRFIDPLTAFKSKEQLIFQETPSGACIKNSANYKSKVEKGKSTHRKFNAEIDTCIDFWMCFECSFYAVVVEVEQIHKLLSLYDSILEKLEKVSINSNAGDGLGKVLGRVTEILERINRKHPKSYAEASEMNKKEPPPLWADSFAIEDIIGE